MGQRDEQIVALKAAGRSIRDIAAEVGLSKSQVQRVLSTPAPTAAQVVALEALDGVDPVVAELTARELGYLGYVNAEGKPYRPVKLTVLQEYRLQSVSCLRAAGTEFPRVSRRRAAMTKYERDAEIRRLWRLGGCTLEEIGRALRPRIAKGTVQRIVARMEEDGLLVDDETDDDGDDWDDDEVVEPPPGPEPRLQPGAVGKRREAWRRGG